MKTAIKTIFATALTAIVLSSSAFAADPTTSSNYAKQVTLLNDVKNVSKIKVSGNVELILVQSPVEYIKVYDNYYAKNAMVQQQNGALFISSFEVEPLTVVAYVNNLSEVEATDNAQVKTLKTLNLIGLDVKLKNNATADLSLNVVNLNTRVSGKSSLTITGAAADLSANVESVAKLNMDKFSADNTLITAKNAAVAKKAIIETVEFGVE